MPLALDTPDAATRGTTDFKRALVRVKTIDPSSVHDRRSVARSTRLTTQMSDTHSLSAGLLDCRPSRSIARLTVREETGFERPVFTSSAIASRELRRFTSTKPLRARPLLAKRRRGQPCPSVFGVAGGLRCWWATYATVLCLRSSDGALLQVQRRRDDAVAVVAVGHLL